jgi:6-pyruvoyltetrahydropterin/6-carboxytetrahydropterin synthase
MKITQAFRFEAAHRLPNVPPAHRCYRMHGHSYRVEATLAGSPDPHTGFIVDFFDIQNALAELIAQLDHQCLNEIEGLENPTAENIAIWLWVRAKPQLPQLGTIRIYETADSWVEYEGKNA